MEEEIDFLEAEEIDIDARFSRFKGADWFTWLLNRDVIVGGAGGIGSFLSLFLSRLGMNIYLFDHDFYESHNMSGQCVRNQDIGKLKTDTAIEIAKEFSNHSSIQGLGKYESDSEYCPIMISGFDNMKARKNMFANWKLQLEENPEVAKEALFLDGRLLANQYQIFCVQGDKPDQIERYEKEFLFDDSEVEDVDCTLKQTTHCAAGIASHMIGFLTNFASNVVNEGKFNQVPFRYEYITNVNFTENEV